MALVSKSTLPFVKRGSGGPVTVIAVGGSGTGDIGQVVFWSHGIDGSQVGFEYGKVAPWIPDRPPRREADRDAAEARAVVDRFGATQAIGSSRGARALLGVLANGVTRLERVVLAIPPGGTAAGRYRDWLAELPQRATAPVTDAAILIPAFGGDSSHPLTLAEEWAERLGARLEVFPSLHRNPEVYEAMREVIREFLNSRS
jgi:hypothetical protein